MAIYFSLNSPYSTSKLSRLSNHPLPSARESYSVGSSNPAAPTWNCPASRISPPRARVSPSSCPRSRPWGFRRGSPRPWASSAARRLLARARSCASWGSARAPGSLSSRRGRSAPPSALRRRTEREREKKKKKLTPMRDLRMVNHAPIAS